MLIAWSAVHERVTQIALADPVIAERWNHGRTGFDEYKKAFHARMLGRSTSLFKRYAKEVIQPRDERDINALREMGVLRSTKPRIAATLERIAELQRSESEKVSE